MTHPNLRPFSPWRTLKSAVYPLTGLSLLTGWFVGGLSGVQAAEVLSPVMMSAASAGNYQLQAQSSTPKPAATQAATKSPLADGVYLYGEAPEPEQIGRAYMVFEVNKGQVIGAFYMPRSSFDCFSGSFQADQLALNVVDSYEKTVHPYAIAFERNSTVASNSNRPTIAEVGLQGYHRLAKISDNDKRILGVCQANPGTK